MMLVKEEPVFVPQKQENATVIDMTKQKKCILCGHRIYGESKNILFCKSCRKHSQRYHFAEWLR